MADPLAGGSSFSSCEPKTEFDEELDFFSSKFNPHRALFTPDVVVPYPEIKSFDSVKDYEGAIKSRAKSRTATAESTKSNKNVDTPHEPESAAHEEAQQSKEVKSLSSEVSTSCDTPVVESVEKRMEKQRKLPSCDSPSESTPLTTEEEALDLSLKTSSVLAQATPTRTGSPSATSSRDYGKLSNYSSSREEEKKYPKSSLKNKLLSARSHSSHERSASSSWRSLNASGSHERSASSSWRSPETSGSHERSASSPWRSVEMPGSHERSASSLWRSSETSGSHERSASSPWRSAEVPGSHERSASSSWRSTETSGSHDRFASSPWRSTEASGSHERSASTSWRSAGSHERSSSSWRSAEASGSHEKSKKSHSAARNDNSSHAPVKNLTVQFLCTSSEDLSDRIVKDPDYLRKSEKHSRVSGSTDEKRSHSGSSHYSEKQREFPRSQERSSRDTSMLSRTNEKSADTPVKSQERRSQASKHSKRPAGTFFFSSKNTETCLSRGREERQLTSDSTTSETRVKFSASHSDSRTERRHSEKKQSHQTQNLRLGGLPKTPVDYKKEIPPSDAKKSQKAKMRNVFVRMENMTGPLHVLTRCVQERLQVRVMTRGAVTVKSICRGYVVAFDKHFNMALADVDEVYRRPAVLGKIKSKRSQKLLAAQKTLQKEREEYVAKWNDEQSLKHASSSLQDLSLEPSGSKDQKFSSHVSKHQEEQPTAATSPSVHLVKEPHNSTSKSSQTASASLLYPASGEEEAQNPLNKLSKCAQARLRRIQSVYEGHKVPLSPFEREALMLGIPDENLVHRHINKLLVRGENVVSVSIIEDI